MTLTEHAQPAVPGEPSPGPDRPALADAHPRPLGTKPSRGRQDWFRVLALIVVAIFLVRSTNLLAPWFFVLTPDEPHPEPHRWFYTVAAAGDLFLLVGFAVLMNRLRRPPMACVVALWLLLALTMIAPFDPGFLVLLIFVVPAYLVYPYWRDLRVAGAWWGGAHRWLVAFAAVVGAGLLATSVVAMRRQVVNDGAVADAHLWNGYAMHSALIAVVAVLAAGTAPGARLLRGWLGLLSIYLGAIATFALPDATGSWGVAGGITAMVVGGVLIVTTWWDRRADRRTSEQQVQGVPTPAADDRPAGERQLAGSGGLPGQRHDDEKLPEHDAASAVGHPA